MAGTRKGMGPRADFTFRLMVNVYPDKVWVAVAHGDLTQGDKSDISWRRTFRRPEGKSHRECVEKALSVARAEQDDWWKKAEPVPDVEW